MHTQIYKRMHMYTLRHPQLYDVMVTNMHMHTHMPPSPHT